MIDSMKEQKIKSLTLVHSAIIAFYTLSPFLYLLKPMQASEFLVPILLRAMEPFLIVVTGGTILYQVLRSGKIKTDLYILSILLLSVYAVFAGFIVGNESRYVVSSVSHVLAGLLLYWYNRYVLVNDSYIERFIKKLIAYSVFSNTTVILLMYLMNKFLGTGYYIGLDASIYLLALFWWLDKKKVQYILFCLIMIFLSGKRGVLVVAMLGLSLSWLSLSIARTRLFFKIAMVGVIALVGIQVSGVDLTKSKAFQKIESIRTMSIAQYSSERMAEIKSAWKGWMDNPVEVMLGSGFGFSYTFFYDDPSVPPQEDYHNVHFSPLNILIIWGLPLSLVVFSLLFYLLWRIRGRFRGLEGVARLTVYSYFIYSLFVFNLFNEPILWTLVGILLNPYRTKEGTNEKS